MMIPIRPEITVRKLASMSVVAVALLYVVGGGTLLKHAVDAHTASVASVDAPGPTEVAGLVNDEILAQALAQADATWEAGADAVCTHGDPVSIETQELCDQLLAFRARHYSQSTPVVSPPPQPNFAAPGTQG
jgi:hypothetical protein